MSWIQARISNDCNCADFRNGLFEGTIMNTLYIVPTEELCKDTGMSEFSLLYKRNHKVAC